MSLLVLVVAAGITLILMLEHSPGFRRDILGKVENSLHESTGAELSVRDFKLSLSTLSLDLYNVVVHGREAASEQPLLQTDHLRVGLTIDSLLGRKWHVREIIIDHPAVHYMVNKAGENNLPVPPKKSTSSSNTNVFDLAIRELRLDRGEVYYNDQKTPLDAELHNLMLNANYETNLNKYSGVLGYNNGRIVYGKYAPVEHNLQANFSVTPQTFSLGKLALATGNSSIQLNAHVDNYSSGQMQANGNYDAVLVAGDFQRILKDPTLPTGTIRLTGQMAYGADPNKPMLETVSVNGNISSTGLAMKTPSLQAEVRDIFANYKLTNGNAEVENIRARILGGTLNGKLVVRDITGAQQGRLEATVKDISLDQAQTATKTTSLRQAHLSGRVNANMEAHWAKSIDNLLAHSDATIQASVGQGPATPINGVIHADYVNAQKQIALTQSYIRTPQTTINLNGKVSDRSQLQVAVRSNNLHELELLSAALQKPTPGQPPQPLGLYGTANLNATISGSLSAPQVNGQFDTSNLRVKGSAWKVARASFSANPSQAKITNGELQAVPRGQFKFNAQAGLNHWSFTPNSPIEANLTASQLSIADLQHLANENYPVTGTLALNVSLHGSQLKPVGKGSLTVSNAKMASESVQNIDVKFQGDGNTINATLNVRMPAGTAHADLAYLPKTEGYQAKIQAQNFRLEKLQTVKDRNLQVTGALNLNVMGQGTVKDPQIDASLEIPQLQMKQQTIQGIKLQTNLKNHVATIALDSDVAKTFIKANGTVGIEAPYMADVKLDTGRIDFQTLMAIYAPAQANDVSGQTELHASVRGPLAEKSRVEAHLEIPTLAMGYKQVNLAAQKPIRADYQNGVATLQPVAIRGTGTSIDAQATVPVTSLKAATFLVKGNIDLSVAQMFVPDLQSSGQLQFDVDSSRYGVGSNLNGQIRIVNANLHTTDAPLGLDKANGVINVTQTRLEVASFEGESGGGTITASGGVAYRPALQFNLGVAANNIRLRYPDGVRAILASNLALTGNTQASVLSGQVRIGRVSFTPDFDLTTFLGQFKSDSVDAGTPGSLTQTMKLDIAVQSTSEMNLVSSQVSIRGSANLRVAGTAAAPVILGRTTLTGGEFFLAGNRYEVQQGTVDFVNPVHTEPVVNIQVRTTINDYNITLGLNGPMDRLETTYTSDPSLPPVDIIRLVATGKTETAANAPGSSTSSMGPESLLASGISSQASSKIAKLAGISQLQIDPALGSDNGQNPGARIAVQQRVTGNLLVTFATDVTSTQREAIQVEYKLNPKWSVSGTRDQNGGFTMTGRYHKDF